MRRQLRQPWAEPYAESTSPGIDPVEELEPPDFEDCFSSTLVYINMIYQRPYIADSPLCNWRGELASKHRAQRCSAEAAVRPVTTFPSLPALIRPPACGQRPARTRNNDLICLVLGFGLSTRSDSGIATKFVLTNLDIFRHLSSGFLMPFCI